MCPGEDKSMLSITSSDKDIEQQFRDLDKEKESQERKDREKKLKKSLRHLAVEADSDNDSDKCSQDKLSTEGTDSITFRHEVKNYQKVTELKKKRKARGREWGIADLWHNTDVEDSRLRRTKSLPGSLGEDRNFIQDWILPHSASARSLGGADECLDILPSSSSVSSESRRSSSILEPIYLSTETAVQSRNKETLYQQTLKQKKEQDLENYKKATNDSASDEEKDDYLNPKEWLGLGIVIKRNSDQEYEIIDVASGGVGDILNFCVGDKLSLSQDTDIFDLTKDLRAGKFDKVAFLKDASGNSKIKFDQDTKNTLEATFKFGGARTFTKNDQKIALKDNDELDIDSKIKDAKAHFGLEREFVIEEEGGNFVFKGRSANKIRKRHDLKNYSLSCQQTKSKEAINEDLSSGKIDEYSFKDSGGNDRTDEVKKSFKENCIDFLILKINSEQYGLQNDDEIKIDKNEFLVFLNSQDNKEYLPLLISNYQNDKKIILENEKFKIEGKEVQFNSKALLRFVDFQIKCGSLSLFNKIGKYSKEIGGDLSIYNLAEKIKNPSVVISPLGAKQASAVGLDVSAALA
tara:strand:- start:2561 stop:4291 length:1731 start_codon:yes stop_codon:yes gene_type:complete